VYKHDVVTWMKCTPMAEMVSWTVPGLGGSTNAAVGGVLRLADRMTQKPGPLLARNVAQAGQRGAAAVRVGCRRSPHPVDAQLAVASVAAAVATAVVAAMPAAGTGVATAAAASAAVRLPAPTLDALTAGVVGAVLWALPRRGGGGGGGRRARRRPGR